MKSKRPSNEELHRQMWGILAETGAKYKFIAIEKMKHQPLHDNDCFACDEAFKRSGLEIKREVLAPCEFCPVKWVKEQNKENYTWCCRPESLFKKWDDSEDHEKKDREKRRSLALKISKMKWR